MSRARSALVIGSAGQDGSYLCELLVEKGYRVVGTVRGDPRAHIPNLESIRDRIELVGADLLDFDTVAGAIAEHQPDELYNFASASFGPDAWNDPAGTIELAGVAVARLLGSIRRTESAPRFFQASSAWVFGRPAESPQTEHTPYAPVEPYGAAKALGDFLVRAHRERFGVFACSGIYFNHESPRRPERFVTRKITKAVATISAGRASSLELGDLDARRDWGYAPDYVRAAWQMLQADEPADYVIATGETHTVREFVELAFAGAGLDWERHVELDPGLVREGQVGNLAGSPAAARAALGWTPTVTFDELVGLLLESDLRSQGLRARSGSSSRAGPLRRRSDSGF